jgi:MFS family permease
MKRQHIYLANFFLTVHTALAAYVNSSFLAQFVGEDRVGLVFALVSAFAILLLWWTPLLLRRWGLRRTTLWLGVLNALLTWPLVSLGLPVFVILTFAAYYLVGFVIRFNIDVYLESRSDDGHTGGIRGLFLTIINAGWMVAPILAGWLIGENVGGQGFTRLYLVAGLLLIPFLWIGRRHLHEPEPLASSQLPSSSYISADLRRVLFLQFLLDFFYAIMVIYLPIYLHQTVGLSWPEIGVAFTVMLSAFVLSQWPLGLIADKWLGEKEILAGGLLVTALSTLFIGSITSTSVVVWSLILFATRIGASAIEVMNEVYLFKHINVTDTAKLRLFRIAYPLSFVVAPLLVSLLLPYVTLGTIVDASGLVMLLGLPAALTLKDTK